MSVLQDFAKAAALVGSTAVALFAAQPIAAKDVPVVVRADPALRTERVSFAGLDLTSARDVRKLHLKVASAVKRVCLFDNNRAKLQASDYYPCADGALQNARPQIDRAIAGGSRVAATSITVTAFGG